VAVLGVVGPGEGKPVLPVGFLDVPDHVQLVECLDTLLRKGLPAFVGALADDPFAQRHAVAGDVAVGHP
jgi:hypothetical protein